MTVEKWQQADDGDDPKRWERHADYLHEQTPLSERQAEVLALRKAGASNDQIATVLDLSTNTVQNHWAEVLAKLDQAKEFRVLMGPHPWGENTGWTDACDKTLWELRAHAAYERADTPQRTRVELELYKGEWNVTSNDYLLVEREIVDTEAWETTTTERRSAHEVNALRSHIYKDATSPREYYIRWMLLEESGIDPGADYAPSAASVLGHDVSEKARNEALAEAGDIVESTRYR